MIAISELLGPGDLKTLKRYAHPDFEHKLSAINEWDLQKQSSSKGGFAARRYIFGDSKLTYYHAVRLSCYNI